METEQKFLHTIANNIIWYLIPKSASRTLHTIFRKNDINFSKEEYLKLPNFASDYFSFSFVRNPYDRLASCYTQKIVTQNSKPGKLRTTLRWELNYQKPSFKNFIKIIAEKDNITKDRHWNLYHNLIPVNDIDFIGKFENLQEDFNTICDKIGIPHQELPHANKSKHKHYTEYYDDETRQIVAEKYAKDIEYFNYEFGE